MGISGRRRDSIVTSCSQDVRRAQRFSRHFRYVTHLTYGRLLYPIDDTIRLHADVFTNPCLFLFVSPIDVYQWLKLHTQLPADDLQSYVEAMARDGATTMTFMADAEYTKVELVGRLGVKQPHTGSVLRAIEEYRNATAQSFSRPPPVNPEWESTEGRKRRGDTNTAEGMGSAAAKPSAPPGC